MAINCLTKLKDAIETISPNVTVFLNSEYDNFCLHKTGRVEVIKISQITHLLNENNYDYEIVAKDMIDIFKK